MADIKEIILRSHVGRVGEGSPVKPVSKEKIKGPSFEQVLDGQLNISKHAVRRLDARNIQLSDSQHGQISDALSTLESKGAQDSLVLMDELALVVNVPSKTVVTAMTKEQMQERVFTNIDSTIIVG